MRSKNGLMLRGFPSRWPLRNLPRARLTFSPGPLAAALKLAPPKAQPFHRFARHAHAADLHRLVADTLDDEPAVDDLAFQGVEGASAVAEHGDLFPARAEAAQILQGESRGCRGWLWLDGRLFRWLNGNRLVLRRRFTRRRILEAPRIPSGG